MLPLKIKTSSAWLEAVLDDFDSFLKDHAACERKASAMAMSVLAHYADQAVIVEAMLDLAMEELHHFRQVMKLMLARQLYLPPDTKDAYISTLRLHIRNGREAYFLDRMLVASIVEARGCERFGMIAEALPDSHNDARELKEFYQTITQSEGRHYELFLNLAKRYFPDAEVYTRFDELLEYEANIVAELPIRAALH